MLTPTPDGGTKLDYTIGFDGPGPAAPIVGKILTAAIGKGLGKLCP